MKHIAALTAIGRDRPGIVSAVSRILFRRGCNIEDSSMTILRGEFAMILVISLPGPSAMRPLEKDLKDMARRMKLFAALKELSTPPPAARRRPVKPHIISVLGSDRPGIVYEVSDLLASRRVNITDLNTRLIGTKSRPVYAMVIEAELPTRLPAAKLAGDLEKLSRKMGVTVTVKPLDAVEL